MPRSVCPMNSANQAEILSTGMSQQGRANIPFDGMDHRHRPFPADVEAQRSAPNASRTFPPVPVADDAAPTPNMSGPDIDPPSMKSATWLEFVEAKKASTEFCGDDAEDLRLSEKAMALVPKALATLDEDPVDDDMHLTSAAGAYDMLSKIVEASVDKSALAYAMVVKDIEKDYPDDRRAKWEAAKSGTLAEVPVALKEGFGDVHPDWTVDDILKDARAKQEVQNNIAASMGTFWAKNKDRLLEFDDMEFHATEKQVKKVEARRESALLEKCAEKKKAADAWE
jgi:hypothetical protein